MVNYVYMGYGITDETGKAHLEYDSSGTPITHSYTGTGAGEVDIVASLDSTIGDSSIVSETYSLWDYIRYDYGTQSNHNDIWTPTTSTPTLTRGNDYSTINEGTGSYAEYRTQIQNTDCVIEMDIRKVDGGNSWVTSLVQGSTQLTGCGVGTDKYNVWLHFKIVIEGTTIKFYRDDETSAFVTRNGITRDTSQPLYFGFSTPQDVTTVDFKDFKVYPI